MENTVLVLVAHGSENRPMAAKFLLDLADAIRKQDAVSAVVPLFMYGLPSITEFEHIPATSARVVVVPVFMGRGHYTETLVPKALHLDRHPDVVFTAPLGCHPQMPDHIAAQALNAVQHAGLSPETTSLMLVAHGSSRSKAAKESTVWQAQAIGRNNLFARVEVGFLEQTPHAEGWRDMFPQGDLVIVPLLLAKGLHGNEDIPALFGFGPDGGVMQDRNGRTVILMPGLGVEPELVRLVLDLAAPKEFTKL